MAFLNMPTRLHYSKFPILSKIHLGSTEKHYLHPTIIYLFYFKPIPHRNSFNAFVKRTDTDQAALASVYYVCACTFGISGPTLVHLTSKFFVLCTTVNFY